MKLLRLLAIFFLILVIFAIFGVVAGIILVKFNPASSAGKSIRQTLIKIPTAVSILHLNQPGDNRVVYLSARNPTLQVVIATISQVNPDTETKQWLDEIISQTVNKDLVFLPQVALSQSSEKSYTTGDLNDLYKEIKNKNSTADLYIIYVTEYADDPGYVGITLQRDAMFIFQKTLQSITQDPDILRRLTRSTIMHEWGHLLSLEHVSDLGCVMSEDVEYFANRRLRKSQVPLEFCWDSKYKLEKMQKEYR